MQFMQSVNYLLLQNKMFEYKNSGLLIITINLWYTASNLMVALHFYTISYIGPRDEMI